MKIKTWVNLYFCVILGYRRDRLRRRLPWEHWRQFKFLLQKAVAEKKNIREAKNLVGRVFFVLGIFDKIYGKIGFW